MHVKIVFMYNHIDLKPERMLGVENVREFFFLPSYTKVSFGQTDPQLINIVNFVRRFG